MYINLQFHSYVHANKMELIKIYCKSTVIKNKKQTSKKEYIIGSKAQLMITTSRHNIYATLVEIEKPNNVIFAFSEVKLGKLKNL